MDSRLVEVRRLARKVVVFGREPHRDTYIIGRQGMVMLYGAIFAKKGKK